MCTFMIKSGLSFAQHVNHLYKMFIKMLYLQKDLAGVRTIMGISYYKT